MTRMITDAIINEFYYGKKKEYYWTNDSDKNKILFQTLTQETQETTEKLSESKPNE